MKIFILSGKSLELREVRLFKTKVAVAGILLGVLTVGVLLITNFLADDFLGLGHNKMSVLSTENRILKEQLKDLSAKLSSVKESVGALATRGNELRLLVDLTQIDEETQTASVGGGKRISDYRLTSEAEEILEGAQTLIDQLMREVRLQQSSYEEIYKRYEHNKRLFAALPAVKPMQGYYSVNGFGMRLHPVLRVYRMHEGIDITNDVGTSVYATGDGVVRYAGRTQGGYGAVIEISHGFGYTSLYAHLSKTLVRPGQTVKRGELIAKSGRSGLVSGPHLHYEVRFNGRKQNPVDYFFDDVDAARYRALLAQAP
jgi:murein DD-endopeptidase MepM/ murein hydrolase activator NlpD